MIICLKKIIKCVYGLALCRKTNSNVARAIGDEGEKTAVRCCGITFLKNIAMTWPFQTFEDGISERSFLKDN